MYTTLKKSFYQRDTVDVARDLLGKLLVREISGQCMTGIITETESYGGADDPASHAYRGFTKRNAPMFGEVGRVYVYFVYGNYFCVNIVAKASDVQAGAVLIRAIQPIDGIEYMQHYRTKKELKTLTNGPGKLTQALQINTYYNSIDVTQKGALYVLHHEHCDIKRIVTTERIGIRYGKDKLWRFIMR